MRSSVRVLFVCLLVSLSVLTAPAQPGTTQVAVAQSFTSDDPVIRTIWDEGVERSQIYELGQVMMDLIGPRLTGSPGMARANDWSVAKYTEWGIEAYKEQYGTWRGWERGISHVDLISPRVRSLEGMAAAWSPATEGPVEAEVVILADAGNSVAFESWLPEVNGKFVLISRPETSCRPQDNVEWFARPETLARINEERSQAVAAWRQREENTGVDRQMLPERLEAAGAAGIIRSQWSAGWGVNKIFGTRAERAPVFDLSCEAYGLVFRLAENGQEPVLRVNAEARFLSLIHI